MHDPRRLAIPAAHLARETVYEARHDGLADAFAERANHPAATVGRRVADPDPGHDVGVVGHDPGVWDLAVAIVAGPGFARHLAVPAETPLVLVLLEHVGDLVGLGRRQDRLPAGQVMREDGLAA